MKEVRFFYAPDAATSTELPQEEAMHALRVLRLKSGDEMMLMDGKGSFYRAEVTLAHTHHCFYEIKESLPQQPQWKGRVHLAIAPTKLMDRMEWMTEKAVEIGIDELSFLKSNRAVRLGSRQSTRLSRSPISLPSLVKAANILPIAMTRFLVPIYMKSCRSHRIPMMRWC